MIVTKIPTNDAALKTGSSANWEILPACLSYVDRCFGDITSRSYRHLGSINFAAIKAASPANEKVQNSKSKIHNEIEATPTWGLELGISDPNSRITTLGYSSLDWRIGIWESTVMYDGLSIDRET